MNSNNKDLQEARQLNSQSGSTSSNWATTSATSTNTTIAGSNSTDLQETRKENERSRQNKSR